jgi:hypothetical protein
LKHFGEAVAVLACTVAFFYGPFSLVLSPFLWTYLAVSVVVALWKRDRCSPWVRCTGYHVIALIFLFAFAPQYGAEQSLSTGHWDGRTLLFVVDDIRRQTGLNVDLSAAMDPSASAALSERLHWDGNRMRLGSAMCELNRRTRLEFSLRTGFMVAASLSGRNMIMSILVCEEADRTTDEVRRQKGSRR